MINARFTLEMKDILKKMKGAEFLCYSASEIYAGETIHDGGIYLQTSNVLVKISNVERSIPWFKHKYLSDRENIFCFHCEEVGQKQGSDTVFVREKIENIELVTDYIKILQAEYEIALDMALIITTSKRRYVISRGWHFGEYLDINTDKDYNDIYPVQQVIEEWNNFGEWEVNVERKIEKL